MKWKTKEYFKWIEEGCPKNENVTKLCIHCLNLSSLKGIENLINLTYLDCSHNSLMSLEGIEDLVNLTYLNCSYNRLTSLEGIENLVNLTYLNCSYNNLTSLKGIEILVNLNCLFCFDNNLTSLKGIENLVNLKIINCYRNNLTSLKGIENLVNLKIINCCRNNLTSLKGIENLVNLKELDCSDNNLTSLEELENSVNLKEFYCSLNNLTSLKGIENLVNLKNLLFSKNNLTSLKGIENLVDLIYLNCSNNKLTSLKGIENSVNLTCLDCSENNLTSLNEIINLRRLNKIYHYGNLIEHIPPNIQRILDRQKNGQNIYRDSQNVHNYQIQQSITKSINNILQFKPTITNLENLILNDQILTIQTKELLFEYMNDNSIHTILNITFKELLLYVFERIKINEHENEIKNILNIEMNDSICKCFTGRISRLINCLNGFDPLVNITIANNEQISQIINAVFNKIKDNYSVEEHKTQVSEQLSEMGYSKDVIYIWIEAIE